MYPETLGEGEAALKWGPTILTSGGAIMLVTESHTPSCPGPGEWQGRRGGKSHDAYTGMTHIIVGYGM